MKRWIAVVAGLLLIAGAAFAIQIMCRPASFDVRVADGKRQFDDWLKRQLRDEIHPGDDVTMRANPGDQPAADFAHEVGAFLRTQGVEVGPPVLDSDRPVHGMYLEKSKYDFNRRNLFVGTIGPPDERDPNWSKWSVFVGIAAIVAAIGIAVSQHHGRSSGTEKVQTSETQKSSIGTIGGVGGSVFSGSVHAGVFILNSGSKQSADEGERAPVSVTGAVAAPEVVPGRLPSVPDVKAEILKARLGEPYEYPCGPLRPESILGDIEGVPPLQRKAKGESYRDIAVKWSGLIGDIRRHHRNPESLAVMMYATVEEFHRRIGAFTFDAPDGPGWSLLHEGTFLSVTGVIEDASGSSIFLRDVVITEVR